MKRIILCADGTWNEAEKRDPTTGRPQPTNVLKVARAVLPRSRIGVDQVLYYYEGVGTGGGLDSITGGAFGAGMARNVRALYRFVVNNFEPGDELYFFGFSRGAFTVRTLAGFMNRVGLLKKDDEYYTPEIYDLYQKKTPTNSPEWHHAFRNIRGVGQCPDITFIGVWDTVGALGAPGVIGQVFNRDKYKYHDIGLNANIQHAYHALAIDERRKPFAPSFWTKPPLWGGSLEQVWFPGVHSNVGGSYRPDGLANEALHWMVEKAEALGLEFDDAYLRHFRPCFNSTLHDSMSVAYRVMGPHVRVLGQHPADGEAVHQAAIDRTQLLSCNYVPENLAQYLDSGGAAITTTRRVPRGTPCPS